MKRTSFDLSRRRWKSKPKPLFLGIDALGSTEGCTSEPELRLTSSLHWEVSVRQKPVNLADKFSEIQDYWNPRVAGELNGQQVKLAKIKGEFVWHHHQNEDELFLVLKGVLTLQLREGVVTLRPGEFFIVPRGVEHKPAAEEEVHLLMFEPASTLNTGNVKNELTVASPKRI